MTAILSVILFTKWQQFFQLYQFTKSQQSLSDVLIHLMAANSFRCIRLPYSLWIYEFGLWLRYHDRNYLWQLIVSVVSVHLMPEKPFRYINSPYGSKFFQMCQFTFYQQILSDVSVYRMAAIFMPRHQKSGGVLCYSL